MIIRLNEGQQVESNRLERIFALGNKLKFMLSEQDGNHALSVEMASKDEALFVQGGIEDAYRAQESFVDVEALVKEYRGAVDVR